MPGIGIIELLNRDINSVIEFIDKYIQSSKNIKNTTNGALMLVLVGRMASIKNHKLMLDALKILVLNHDVTLTIVGDGPDFDKINKYAKENGLADYIEFLGFRNDVENILIYKDVFVLTSNYEYGIANNCNACWWYSRNCSA